MTDSMSDRATRRADAPYLPAGIGLMCKWQCMQCRNRFSSYAGRKKWRGLWRCGACASICTAENSGRSIASPRAIAA